MKQRSEQNEGKLSGKRRTRISIFFKSTMKRINFIFPQEKKNKFYLSFSFYLPCLVSRWGDERKVSTAEYLKLWKVVNLVAFFFPSRFRSILQPRQKLLLLLHRSPPTSSPSERNSELKRSFVKKVSTIYSPFFPSFSNCDSLRLVSSGEMDNQRFIRSQLNRAYSEI